MKQWIHAALWAVRHITGRLTAPEISLIAKYIRPTDAFVDVGAHAGSWSVPISRLVPQGKVFAIEALPYYARTLQLLFALLGRRNITVLNLAVTATPTTVRMVWQDPSGKRITGFTHIAGKGEVDTGTVEVPGKPMDSVIPEEAPVRLIKIDVEGAELGVLKGGRGLIERHQPIIFMEVVEDLLARYDTSVADIFGFMDGLGYSGYGVTDQSLRPLAGPADYREHDIVFAPRALKLGAL